MLKTLTNSIILIRKVGTNFTQCVHRVRLRPVNPQSRVDDLTVFGFGNLQCNPSMGHFRAEPTLFDEKILSLIEPPTTVLITQNETEDPPTVTVCFQSLQRAYQSDWQRTRLLYAHLMRHWP